MPQVISIRDMFSNLLYSYSYEECILHGVSWTYVIFDN